MQAQSKTEFDLKEYVPLIEEVIKSGGEFRLFPRGTSMMPLLRQGKDSVILVKCEKAPKKRDVIFYKRPNGQFVLHRILKCSKDGKYLLCGDNQTVLEKGITNEMIIAVVSAIYRDEKRVEKNSVFRKLYEVFWCIMPLRKLAFLVRPLLSKLKRIFVRKIRE